jgi:hypothetical protein
MQILILLEEELSELVQQLAAIEHCSIEQWLVDAISKAAHKDARILGLPLPQSRPSGRQDCEAVTLRTG